jgi:tRNA-splicing ligase RtcB
MKTMDVQEGVSVRLWTEFVPVEDEAVRQLQALAKLPVIAGPLAVMPDVHVGKGATVGSVIPFRAAVIPSAVGVDIGCGMVAVKTSLKASDLPDSLASLRNDIEAAIPVGFAEHATPEKALSGCDASLVARSLAIKERFDRLVIAPKIGMRDRMKPWKQQATQGGGNHFAELALDKEDSLWVMLHSGSRGVGNLIGSYAIAQAREIAQRENRTLPDRDLAWLDQGTQAFDEYIEGMLWAQDYAALNRDLMMAKILRLMRERFGEAFRVEGEAINCHHNFCSLEEHGGEHLWITRKGAVSAREGQMGIIPGSMGGRSYIVRGKGNAQSYHSCSHGAGRRLSRGAAKRQLTVKDLERQTEGVECRKDAGVLDEAPAAYKDIDAVMESQKDLVEAVATLKAILCVKG